MPQTLINTTLDLVEGETQFILLSAWANAAHDVRVFVSHVDPHPLQGKIPIAYGYGVQSTTVQSVGIVREFGRFESVGYGHTLIMTGFNNSTSLVLYRRKVNQSSLRMRMRILQVNFSV